MIANRQDGGAETISPEAQESLLRLIVSSEGKRISSTTLDGRTVWIKRYDVELPTLPNKLHSVLSRFAPHPFLRASPAVGPEGQAERELRKLSTFRAAGIPVPSAIYRGKAALVLSHVAEIAEKKLKRLRGEDSAAHDRVLVESAAALGQVHGAGLCHGRPHPRDMFVNEKHWGFVDFEEEPEAVMPLTTAQARDVWHLFLQISSRALKADTEAAALAAYRSYGPAAVIDELENVVRLLSPLISPLGLMKKVYLGGDGRRILAAMRFLARALVRQGATERGLKEG